MFQKWQKIQNEADQDCSKFVQKLFEKRQKILPTAQKVEQKLYQNSAKNSDWS